WAPDKSVIWKSEMPAWSNATPVIVKKRLFVGAEPATLLCVNLSDGTILWQKTNVYADTMTAEETEKVKSDLKKADELRKEAGELRKQINELKKKQKESGEKDKYKTEIGDLNKQIGELKKEEDTLSSYRMPPTNAGATGYSTATPISDGKYVYAIFGNGVVACYDFKGNRKWIKFIEKPTQDHGSSMSPLIVGGKLIFRFVNLHAINTRNGEVAWKVNVGHKWGTPVAVRIGKVDAIVTAGGICVRASDGKILARGMAGLEYCSPVVRDGVVYFIQHGGRAFKIPSEITKSEDGKTEKAVFEKLWDTKPKKERYYSSPAVGDGLVYAVNQKGVFSAIDAETGEIVYEQKLKMAGTVYPSISLAGKYIYVASEGGTTVVLEAGREFKEVAVNKLEKMRSSPVFVGKRLYIRGMKNLYCIGQ
ncbi:MAG: PQQ-binding-like beta-propeller repeat protein, partial [Planctomycetia bacterium]|nr:PQQ-binding-like beta-propeller repeat protein [Planctomycetia bacterium]